MKKAFTLAEVLITLVIIGVIAALTIPALLNNTNKEEYKTGVKKAYSVLSQAVQTHYALTGKRVEDVADDCGNDADCIFENFYSKRMNIVSSTTPSNSKACTVSGDGDSGDLTFYTADGMAFTINEYGDIVSVDVNGDKKPNLSTKSPDDPKDGGYYFEVEWGGKADNYFKPHGPAKCLIKGNTDDSSCDWSDSDGGSGEGEELR
ncbi:MAG: type II secretion system protein [Candidatus Gastranaerophilales bacterium]|nr:type II secretion system protein [Candidatus Gastranaerophilales bacterium]